MVPVPVPFPESESRSRSRFPSPEFFLVSNNSNDCRPRARLHINSISINTGETEFRLGNQQTGESLTLTSMGEIDPNGHGHFLLRRSCLVGPLERSHFDKPWSCDKKCINFNDYCS